MNFFLSTDIVIDLRSALSLPSVMKQLCITRPGLIYDANLEANLYFHDVLAAIKEAYADCVIYTNSFPGEPTYRHLEDVAAYFREPAPDGFVVIGGGSTMDLAKGVALLQTNAVSALSLKGFPSDVNDPLPLITVPSLLGSGAEVSYNAVFIDEDEGRKLGINSRQNFPKKCVVDPLLSMSAPRKSVIATAMDSMVHCIDSFGSPKQTPLSRVFSIEGFQRIFYALQQDQLDRAESRIDLAIGSICGTVALMNSGDGPSNGFAYYLGVKHKVPHGLAGAVFLKEVMAYNISHGYEKYAVLNPMRETLSARACSEQLMEQMDALYRQLDIPALSSFGFTRENARDFAHQASQALQGSFAGNPVAFDQESALTVINRLM